MTLLQKTCMLLVMALGFSNCSKCSRAAQNSFDALDAFENEVEEMSDPEVDDVTENRRMAAKNDDTADDERQEQSEDNDDNENEANDANLVRDEERERENSVKDENEDINEDDDDNIERDDDDDDDDDDEPKDPVPTGKYASCERGMCELNITPVGCYHDKHKTARPLNLLLDSHRDASSHAYHGEMLNWKTLESSIRKLLCDCVRIARAKKHTHVGLQHYGECWSSKTAAKDFAIDGKSDSCVNGTYKPCKKGDFCIGKEKTNYIYKIEPIVSTCDLGYEKVGCYHDPVTVKHRPLPEVLDNRRDKTHFAHHGKVIDWKNYKASLNELLKHCASRTKQKGYTHFGIEYYGECWSGPKAALTYAKYGNSTQCVNADFAKCNMKYGCPCAGKQKALFVYQLT